MPSRNTKLPAIDEGRDYYHVRFKVPSQFTTCRIPEWAGRAARSISKDANIVMCKKGMGKNATWMLQSVQIKKGHGKTRRKALSLAIRIRNRVES